MEEQTMKTGKKKKLLATKKAKISKELWTVAFLRPIRLLIGNWKFHVMNDEMIVKCFFAKKQIVWEVLINGCIEKIEIDWSNIIGMKASLNGNEPGILELELAQPPKFYRRRDTVHPREHSQWDVGLDFTGQQASKCRRHLVMFPPGMLNQHLVRLINSDRRLLELSQKPYPTIHNPYFFPQTNLLPAQPASSLPSFQPYNQTLQLPLPALNLMQQQSVDGLPSQHSNMLAATNINFQPTSSSHVDDYDIIGCSNIGNMPMPMPMPMMNNNMEPLQAISNTGQLDFNNNNGVISSTNINDFSNWAPSTYRFDSSIGCVTTNGSSIVNVDEPSCSNGASTEYLLNNHVNLGNSSSTTYFGGVSSSFYSTWETDSNGVWKPPFSRGPRKNTN